MGAYDKKQKQSPIMAKMKEVVSLPALKRVQDARERAEQLPTQSPSNNISKEGESKILLTRGYKS